MPFIPWSFDLMFIRDIASIFFIVALHHIYRIIKDFLQDCRVVIWAKNDVAGGGWSLKVLKKFGDVVWHVSWSVTRNILVVSVGDNKPGSKPSVVVKRFVTGGCDNLVKVWKEVDGQWIEEEKLEAHSDWVRDVAWAPNVGLPVSTIASCSQDCRVVIWTKNEVTGGGWSSKVLKKFGDVVWHVSWSVTGNILAVSGGDNKVSLWKESLEGQWVCVSDVYRGQGQETQ